MVSIIKKLMLQLSEYLEIILATYMVVVLLLITGRTIIVETPLIFTEAASLHHFLEGSLTIAIAIEFVKMLSMHTPGTLIEVLLFAIARHMIVESLTPVQNLVFVVAIGVLFLIRKYLLTAHDQKGMNEHASSGASILEDLRHLRKERRSISAGIEDFHEQIRLGKAKKEIQKREKSPGDEGIKRKIKGIDE